MTEKNRQLLNYILNGYSNEEIKKMMNLTDKQFLLRMYQLEYAGYKFKRVFDINGDNFYELSTNITDDGIFNINSNNNKVSFILISDTHVGAKRANIDNTLKQVYKYASDNNIHTIFHLGDLIHGIYTQKKNILCDIDKKYDTIEKQVAAVAEKFPCIPNIITYILLGNHDFYSRYFDGLDVKTLLEHTRLDLVPLDYGVAHVKIRDINIALCHDLMNVRLECPEVSSVVFSGHSHEFVIHTNPIKAIHIPALTKHMNSASYPGFLHVSTDYRRDHLAMKISYVLLTPKPHVVSNTIIDDLDTYKVKKRIPRTQPVKKVIK